MVAKMESVARTLPVLSCNAETVRVLGVDILNLTSADAINLMDAVIAEAVDFSRAIYIVNAHTLNLASEDRYYFETLRDGDVVFGDGTGVRWAARLRGTKMKDNLVGTDLIPALFSKTAGKGYRYFLLGSDVKTIERAAVYSREHFGGWRCAGYHHGYIESIDTNALIDKINNSSPDMLLVGMGNPKQEVWIREHLNRLQVPVCIGVGGLFDHWGGNLTRAASPIRTLGFEWLQLLFQQPQKWRRYVIGNPKFLFRILRAKRSDLKKTTSGAD